MITNKDIRVENGFLIINGDKFPLDGQSPEAIMQIVKDNSDTTPTENSTNPVKSGGVFAELSSISASINNIAASLTFQIFSAEEYPSWDDFPDFAFGYGYQSQINNPGTFGFCLCFGSSSIKIQIFFSLSQTMQKYRTFSSGTWTTWKEF